MGDDEGKKKDNRIDYVKDRIANGFPKLAGPKLDKLLATDEIKWVHASIFNKVLSQLFISYIYIYIYIFAVKF